MQVIKHYRVYSPRVGMSYLLNISRLNGFTFHFFVWPVWWICFHGGFLFYYIFHSRNRPVMGLTVLLNKWIKMIRVKGGEDTQRGGGALATSVCGRYKCLRCPEKHVVCSSTWRYRQHRSVPGAKLGADRAEWHRHEVAKAPALLRTTRRRIAKYFYFVSSRVKAGHNVTLSHETSISDNGRSRQYCLRDLPRDWSQATRLGMNTTFHRWINTALKAPFQ